MKSDFWQHFKWLFIEQTSGIYVSEIELILLVLGLVILIPGYILCIKKNIPMVKIFHRYLVVCYASVIVLFTVARRQAGSRSGKIVTDFDFGMNFNGIYSRMQVIYCLMNILLFVPWGLLISFFRIDDTIAKNIVMSSLVGFLTSFFIEMIQHLTKTGLFEVTDLATNVIGTVIGAALAALLISIFKAFRKNNNEE